MQTKAGFTSLLALATVLAATSLAACGGGAEDITAADPKPPPIAIRATETGDRMNLEAPARADAGLVELELANRGRELHAAQLLRVEGDHGREEVLAAYGATAMGKPVPDWLFAAGGIGLTEPGAVSSVVQRLEPGEYWIVDDAGEGRPHYEAGAVARLLVAGEARSAAPPSASAKVVASDYAFETEGLAPGKNEVRFVNAGAEPHHLIAAPILPGNTVEDVTSSMQEGKRPPIEIDEETASAVLEGGEEQVLEIDLEPGRYALLCFIADRAGGPPHAFKGMADEAVVR